MDPYVDEDHRQGFALLKKQMDWEEGFKDQNVEYGGYLENNQRKPVLTNGGIDLLYEYEMPELVNATVELIKNRHDRDSILSLSQYDPPAPVCAIYNSTRRTLYCGCSSNDPNALDIGLSLEQLWAI